jgi:hypothetical protein
MAAFLILAIDQEIADPGCAHFSEGDFHWAGCRWHAPMIPPIAQEGKPLRLANAFEGHTTGHARFTASGFRSLKQKDADQQTYCKGPEA